MNESLNESVQDLILAAKNNIHTEYTRLNNINEYSAARTLNKGLNKLVWFFSNCAKGAYKEYLINLKNRVDCYQLLLDYRLLKTCEEYYAKERDIVLAAITEFNYYMTSSNIFKILLGHDRRDDENEDE